MAQSCRKIFQHHASHLGDISLYKLKTSAIWGVGMIFVEKKHGKNAWKVRPRKSRWGANPFLASGRLQGTQTLTRNDRV